MADDKVRLESLAAKEVQRRRHRFRARDALGVVRGERDIIIQIITVKLIGSCRNRGTPTVALVRNRNNFNALAPAQGGADVEKLSGKVLMNK